MCSTIVILARWQSCQSANELNRETQWAFFKIEGFAGKRSLLSPPPPPSFHHFALAPFFMRGPNDSFFRFVPERLLRRLASAKSAYHDAHPGVPVSPRQSKWSHFTEHYAPINVKPEERGGGHRVGILTFSKNIIKIPTPGKKTTVKSIYLGFVEIAFRSSIIAIVMLLY